MSTRATRLLEAILSGGNAWARQLRRDISQTEAQLRLANSGLTLDTNLVEGLDRQIEELTARLDKLDTENDDATANQRDSLEESLGVLEANRDRLVRVRGARQAAVLGHTQVLTALQAELKNFQAGKPVSTPHSDSSTEAPSIDESSDTSGGLGVVRRALYKLND